jgi:hypothetical protein
MQLFLYTVFAGCFVLRVINLIDYNRNPDGAHDRIVSYDLLACLAPFLCTLLPATVLIKTAANSSTSTSSASSAQ